MLLPLSSNLFNGLYYLQSRYYDPQIGRFVNADILITARVNIINLFAYCYNQPILYIDDMGYDAYMIFNTEYAKGMGHAALLVENYNSWYYFSVSDKKQDSSMIIDFCYLVKFKNSKTLSALNNDLRSAHSKSLIRYNYKYNGIIYFPGYFSKSFYYFYEYIFSKPKYNLLFNNCLQVASRALSKGTPTGPFANTYRKSIKSLQNIIIPNVAYNKLLAMNASIIAGTIIKVGYCLWRISVK